MQKCCADLETENAGLKADLDSLKHELQSENATLKSEVESLRQLTRDSQRLQQQVNILKEQQAAVVTSRMALEQEVKDKGSEVTRLQKSLKLAEQAEALAQRQCRSLESKLELYKKSQVGCL
jgi:chromosome segregation ATPase